jgi:hypothetical protein
MVGFRQLAGKLPGGDNLENGSAQVPNWVPFGK